MIFLPDPPTHRQPVIDRDDLQDLRILLLQARDPDDPMRGAERRDFADHAGLDQEQLVPHDLLSGPPTLDRVREHDALMVGGSGDYYVSKGNLPHMDETLELLRGVVEAAHPTFASCFGFQLLVAALGGEVVHDPEGTEVGTFEITLTEEGEADPLFGELPKRFPAQVGRKDRASKLPDGVLHLAFSERCSYHALRIPGRPVWATQFHPELDRRRNLDRFRRYLDGYAAYMSEEERRQAFERFEESPEAATLLPRFLETVLAPVG